MPGPGFSGDRGPAKDAQLDTPVRIVGGADRMYILDVGNARLRVVLPDFGDADNDGLGDLCDPCPNDPGNDGDGDGVCTSDGDCCSLKCRGGNVKTCKGGATCTASEDPEVSCSDGQDNDCDGLTDSADPDCSGGTCEPKGTACAADDECCSNKCRGPSGNRSCK